MAYVRETDLHRLKNRGYIRRMKGGKLIFWKIVRADDRGPVCITGSKIRYNDGAVIKTTTCNRNPEVGCARGLNILAAPPAASQNLGNQVVIRVLVDENDIGCVPYTGSYAGVVKLRVRALTVDRETRWASVDRETRWA